MKLGDNADGDVIANAVRIVEVPPVTTPPTVVDNGDAAYAESGSGWRGWNDSASYNGGFRYCAPGTGQNTATWTFDALADDEPYQVWAAWSPGSNRASNAPYSVYDGTQLLSTTRIDQRVAPTGQTADGLTWQRIGTFYPQRGKLVVELSDDADGCVVADAMRVVQPAVYWDPNETGGASLGGSGQWSPDSSDACWYLPGTGDVAWDNSAGYDAVLAGSPGTVTVSGEVTPDSIRFAATGYTVGSAPGGDIALPSAYAPIDVQSGATATLSAALAGGDSLVKAGGGTLLVAAPQSYAGPTTIDGGTLRLGSELTGFGGDGEGWTTNGGASVNGDVLTLTDGNGWEARSAFYDTPLPVNGSFQATFTYQANGDNPADGAAFVLENDPAGADALGGTGGDLGYAGITASAAVAFNIYCGHVRGTQYYTDGDGHDNGGAEYMSTAPVDLSSGDPIQVNLTYDGTNLVETLTDQTTDATFTTTYDDVNLAAQVGGDTAYVGFTGGTGGLASTQTINFLDFALVTGDGNVLPASTSVEIAGGAALDLDGSSQTVASLADAAPGATSGEQVLLGGGTLTVGDNTSTTFSGVISGSGNLTKTGTGTLTLANNETYTGVTTVSAGTLQLGDGLAGNGSVAGNIVNDAALVVADPGAVTLPGVISGSGSLTKQGGGVLTLTSANSYSGGTQIVAGTVALAGTTPLGTGTIELAGGTLQFTTASGFSGSYYNVSNDGYVPDFSGLTPVATRTDATIDFPDDSNGFEPGISGLDTTDSGAVWTGLLNITVGGSYTFETDSDDGSLLYVDGTQVVNDDGPHAMQTASGTVDLAAGGHMVTIEYVQAGGGAGVIAQYSGADTGNAMVDLGSLAGTVSTGGTLNLANAVNVTADSSIRLPDSGGTASLASLSIGGQTLHVLGQGTLAVAGGVVLAGPGSATFDVAGNATLTLSGVVSGDAGLTKSGAGSMVLTAANTYSGTTNIVGGKLQALAAVGADGTDSLPGAVSLSDATLRLSPSFGTETPGFFASYYNVDNSGYVPDFSALTPVATRVDQTVDLPDNSNGFEPSVDGLNATNSGAVWSGLLDVAVGGTYTFQTTSDDGSLLYVDGTQVVNDDGPHAMQTASGSIDLAACSHLVTVEYVQAGGWAGIVAQYSGPDTDDAMVDLGSLNGTVCNVGSNLDPASMKLTNDLSLSGASTIDLDLNATASGTLTAADGSQLTLATDPAAAYGVQRAAFIQTGAVSLAGSLTVKPATADASISGAVGETPPGAGSLVKSGAGTLLLSGEDTYSGGTTLDAGMVNFAALENLGSGGITFDGGTLQYAADNTTDISSRTVTIDAGGATLDVGGNNVTFAQGVGNGGSGGLTKVGTGTLVLSGRNTYAGLTDIGGGTLQLGVDDALPASAVVQVGDPAFGPGTFDLAGHSVTLAGFCTGAESGAHSTYWDDVTNSGASGATLTVDSAGDYVYAGRLSGSFSVVKYGTGTWNLTGEATNSADGASGVAAAVYDGTLEITGCFLSDARTVPGYGNPQVVRAGDPKYTTVMLTLNRNPSSAYQVEQGTDHIANSNDTIDTTGDWQTAVLDLLTGKSVTIGATGTTYTVGGNGGPSDGNNPASNQEWTNPNGGGKVLNDGAFLIGTVGDLDYYVNNVIDNGRHVGTDVFGLDGTDQLETPNSALDANTKVVTMEDEYGKSWSDEDYDDQYWVVTVTPWVVNSTRDVAMEAGQNTPWTGYSNAAGDPECTLRSMIECLDQNGGGTVQFDIPQSDPNYSNGVYTITTTGLPALTEPITIDGSTQPGYVGTPNIQVTGDTNFTVSAGTSTIKDVAIGGSSGLTKTGSGTLTLSGDYTYTGDTTINGGTLQLLPTVSGFGGNGSGWTINGGASVTGDVLTVTGSGANAARSAFYDTPVPVDAPFQATFTYQVGGGGGALADGAAFVLQSASADAATLGRGGDDIGFAGITPSAAVALNWSSGLGSPYPGGTQYYTDGKDQTNGGAEYMPTAPVWLASGDPIQVTLTYDGANLAETLTDQVESRSWSYTYSGANLAAVLGGTAYVGFTGGTGAQGAAQTISNFVLVADGGSVLPASTEVEIAAGATLDLNGCSQTIASLGDATPGNTSGEQVLLGGGTLTVNDTTASSTFSGVISGSGSLTLEPGQTTFDSDPYTYPDAGNYTIAVTVADGTQSTQTTTGLTVNCDPTITTLESSLPDSVYGQSVTFTATVAGAGTLTTTPTGSVNFYEDGGTTPVDTETLTGGQASFTTSALTAGDHSITATYSGDTDFLSSTCTADQTVDQAATTTTAASSPASPTYGDAVTLTATVAAVAPGSGTPTGTVDFYDETTDTPLGTGTLDGGAVAVPISQLVLGAHTITATYSGDDNFLTSQSTFTVTIAPQTLLLQNVEASSFNEGGICTVTGDVVNLDGEAFTVTVDWGGSQGESSFPFAAGTAPTQFAVSHYYTDDDPTGTHQDTYQLTVTVDTVPGGSDAVREADAAPTAQLTNVAPTVHINGPGSFGLGDPVSLSAVVSAPGEADSFTYSWSNSGGGLNETGSGVSFSPSRSNQTDGTSTVTLTVTDDDGDKGTASVTLPWVSTSGSVKPFQPDTPTVSITETDGGTVSAGSQAHFRISRTDNGQGSLTLCYHTEDGPVDDMHPVVAHALVDYTSTYGDQSLTLAPNSSQDITVDTASTSSGGTFSVVVNHLYDASAAQGPYQQGSVSATATITSSSSPAVDVDTDSNNDGTIDDASDDPVRNVSDQPGRILQLNGDRAEVDLSVDYGGASSSSFYAILNSLGAIQVWDSPTGGSQIANGATLTLGPNGVSPSIVWVQGVTEGTGTLELELCRTGSPDNWEDTVKFSVGQIDVKIGSVAEQDEANPGAVIWRNSGFSKENHDANGNIIPNYMADANAGDIKFDPNYQLDCTGTTVTWTSWMTQDCNIKLVFPDDVLVWDATQGIQSGVTPPQITSGAVFSSTSDHLTLWVEGIDDSPGFAADSIQAIAIPKGGDESTGPTIQDKDAHYTVVDVNAAVDGDRNNTIDLADYDDHQLTFWYNNNQDALDPSLGVQTDELPVTSPDGAGNTITCTRDLEDFFRCNVLIDPLLSGISGASETVRFLCADPSTYLNLYKSYYGASGPADQYVINDNLAAWQVSSCGTAAVTQLTNFSEDLRSCLNQSPLGDCGGKYGLLVDAMGSSRQEGWLDFRVTVTYPNGGSTTVDRMIDLKLHDISDFYTREKINYYAGELTCAIH